MCSIYPSRNEALLNAGVTSLSRETAPAYPGFGRIVGHPGWGVMRMSQEHGIVGVTGDSPLLAVSDEAKQEQSIGDEFEVGQRVMLWCNHVCITAAAFFVYFVVDEHDVVTDTWVPWKGW